MVYYAHMPEVRNLSMPPIKWELNQDPVKLHLHEIEEQLADLQAQRRLHPDFLPLVMRVALTRILRTDEPKVVGPKMNEALQGKLPNMEVLYQDTTTALELLQKRVKEKRK